MVITFKSGNKVKITQQTANIIHDQIVKGCSKFQCFSDENNNSILIINLDEIECIGEF